MNAAALGVGDERRRVGLAIERQINRDPGAALECGQALDRRSCEAGTAGMNRRLERTPQ